ncbi:protein of unknown function [uncultured Woeseiaceae bacterium]|uniref:Uncharacterized protein n=1 Tax=uncultured Woeseiaceae bacterium TaxID=1983305 RepID=A0A7D9D345_9GAMM|nr:protein of unknown function [uncultured Woeseiaceae bacterium]
MVELYYVVAHARNLTTSLIRESLPEQKTGELNVRLRVSSEGLTVADIQTPL